MPIHGHTKIELTSQTTGKVETIEKDNIVTNAVSQIFNAFNGMALLREANANGEYGSTSDKSWELLESLYGGILLYDTALGSDPNTLFAPPEANLVGSGVPKVLNNGKGLQRGIIGATIDAMVAKGAAPERIAATLGPCICGDCYEVGDAIADEFDAQFPGTFTLTRFGGPGIDIAKAARMELAKAGVPADSIVDSRPRVNAASQYLYEDEELASLCAADGEGEPALADRWSTVRHSMCTLENPLWYSHRRASLAGKAHEGRLLALIMRG